MTFMYQKYILINAANNYYDSSLRVFQMIYKINPQQIKWVLHIAFYMIFRIVT